MVFLSSERRRLPFRSPNNNSCKKTTRRQGTDLVEEVSPCSSAEGGGHDQEVASPPTKPLVSRSLLTQHTYPSVSRCINGGLAHHPTLDATVTDSTKFSSSSIGECNSSTKKSSRWNHRGFNILKQLTGSRRRSLTEAQLRKRVKKHAERCDWDAVRKSVLDIMDKGG